MNLSVVFSFLEVDFEGEAIGVLQAINKQDGSWGPQPLGCMMHRASGRLVVYIQLCVVSLRRFVPGNVVGAQRIERGFVPRGRCSLHTLFDPQFRHTHSCFVFFVTPCHLGVIWFAMRFSLLPKAILERGSQPAMSCWCNTSPSTPVSRYATRRSTRKLSRARIAFQQMQRKVADETRNPYDQFPSSSCFKFSLLFMVKNTVHVNCREKSSAVLSRSTERANGLLMMLRSLTQDLGMQEYQVMNPLH